MISRKEFFATIIFWTLLTIDISLNYSHCNAERPGEKMVPTDAASPKMLSIGNTA